jgi:phosphoserine phosphatase
MSSVLVLIANPLDTALDRKLAEAIQHETGGEINWLHQRIACEIHDPKSADAVTVARQVIAGRPVDAGLVPTANRRKKVLVADMDSTMIEQECIDELADAVGIKDQVAEITRQAMNGELDFEQALRTRVGLIKGLERKVIEEIRRERITLAPGGRALIHTMKAFGAYTSLVSGGFTFFADYFAKRIGFDEAVANVLEFDSDERLTGTVALPIVDKTTKLTRLQTLAAEHSIPIEQTMAVGDGANDLDMIKASGLGVAVHAKPHIAAEADVRIDFADLTALLYLQGFEEEDIVR